MAYKVIPPNNITFNNLINWIENDEIVILKASDSSQNFNEFFQLTYISAKADGGSVITFADASYLKFIDWHSNNNISIYFLHGLSDAANGGLDINGNFPNITVGHSNVLSSAQTTQAVYPIKIDKNGHISAYGSAVSIPTKVSDLTNDSGYLTLATLPIYDGTVV